MAIGKKKWIYAAVFVTLISGCVAMINTPKTPSNGSTNQAASSSVGISNDVKYAVQACANMGVQRQLKAPSTAKFPTTRNYTFTAKEGANAYHVTSYVDSQNGFGAMIRTNFDCDVIVTDLENVVCQTACQLAQ